MMLDRLESRVAADVSEGASLDVFDDIQKAGCAAAIWQRDLPPVFKAWLDSRPANSLPRLRADVPLEQAAVAVLDACGTSPCTGSRQLARDVGDLAQTFSQATGHRDLHIRLQVVQGDACSKFHVDYVSARLLCTYRGAGTQFGPGGPGGVPLRVQQMRTGEVGLFRGRLWEGDLPCALLHRSPPIAGTGETRLLLVIDPAHQDD